MLLLIRAAVNLQSTIDIKAHNQGKYLFALPFPTCLKAYNSCNPTDVMASSDYFNYFQSATLVTWRGLNYAKALQCLFLSLSNLQRAPQSQSIWDLLV
jgi:hypothetical protein